MIFHYKPWDCGHCGVKGWKIVRIVSLDQLGSRGALQLLIFLSCLSPGRVKKLQKFINSCLKVGHSANLKHSKSSYNWRKLIVLWNVQNHNIKSFEHNGSSALLDRGTGAIYDSCRFDIGSFVRRRLITNLSTPKWHFCVSQCPQ